jgi:hypothetical protein
MTLGRTRALGAIRSGVIAGLDDASLLDAFSIVHDAEHSLGASAGDLAARSHPFESEFTLAGTARAIVRNRRQLQTSGPARARSTRPRAVGARHLQRRAAAFESILEAEALSKRSVRGWRRQSRVLIRHLGDCR